MPLLADPRGTARSTLQGCYRRTLCQPCPPAVGHPGGLSAEARPALHTHAETRCGCLSSGTQTYRFRSANWSSLFKYPPQLETLFRFSPLPPWLDSSPSLCTLNSKTPAAPVGSRLLPRHLGLTRGARRSPGECAKGAKDVYSRTLSPSVIMADL